MEILNYYIEITQKTLQKKWKSSNFFIK
jgi:hypothetical protein